METALLPIGNYAPKFAETVASAIEKMKAGQFDLDLAIEAVAMDVFVSLNAPQETSKLR